MNTEAHDSGAYPARRPRHTAAVPATVTTRRLPPPHPDDPRQLPTNWPEPCPHCGQPRHLLSLTVHLGRRWIGDLVEPWCDTCLDQEGP